jgi:chemotaxis protein histidine kinase CheA
MREKLEIAEEIFFAREDPEPNVLDDAKRSFHTLRGGAGFFGLKEIAEAAGKIEELLSNQNLNSSTACKKVQPLIRELSSLAQPLISQKQT